MDVKIKTHPVKEWVFKRADGTLELPPDIPTLTQLAGNDMVSPDITSFLKAIQSERMRNMPMVINNSSDPELSRIMKSVDKGIKEISKRSGVHVHNHMPIEITAWYQSQIKN